MRKSLKKSALLLFLFLGVFSCVTINIYFPAAAVEKAADEIVEDVWGEKTPPPEKKGEPQSFLGRWTPSVEAKIGPAEAWAQEADINVTTPAIRALKEAIRQRADSIKPYMDQGNIGIGNDGLLSVRSLEGLNIREKASLNQLLHAENRDREALYVEIAEANDFGLDKVPDIKSIFAGSWIRNARIGWWVQDSGGKWHQKK